MLPKLTLVLLALVAFQRGGPGTGGGMGPMVVTGEPTQFERFASKLKLDTRTQVPDVQRIFSSAAADASVFEREMTRLRLRMLETASNADELAKATEAYSAAAAKMAAIEVRAFEEVRALLKSNQLSRTVDAFSIMAGMFHPPTPRGAGTGGRRGGGGGVPLALLAADQGQREGTPQIRSGGAGMRGGGGMGFGVRPTRLAIFTAMFALSDAEKKRVKQILDDEYRAAAPIRNELSKARETIGLAIRDEQGQSVLDQAVAEYAPSVGAMAAAEMKALAKVLGSLERETPPSANSVQIVASLMRGAFVSNKWDTTPDLQFY